MSSKGRYQGRVPSVVAGNETNASCAVGRSVDVGVEVPFDGTGFGLDGLTGVYEAKGAAMAVATTSVGLIPSARGTILVMCDSGPNLHTNSSAFLLIPRGKRGRTLESRHQESLPTIA